MALPPAVVRLEFRLPPAENTLIRLSNTSVEVQPPLGVSWGLARIMREGAVEGKTQEPPCGTNVVQTTF